MDEYMTNHLELERLIEGIPVPDITVSSLSQQSDRYTPQSQKKQSLTREQVQKILRKATESSFQIPPKKPFTLGNFNAKENGGNDRTIKSNNDLVQINTSLRKQLQEKQKIIEDQLTQFAQLNNQIEQLTNEVQDLQQKRNSEQKTLSQLQLINDRQQQTIEELRIELQVSKRIAQSQLNKDSIEMISELKSKIYNLEGELNRTKTTMTLTSPKNDTIIHSEIIPNTNRQTIDPELLSEEDTLQMFLSLLSRVSRSQRMFYLLQKNTDFKQLIKPKRSQASINKISFVQNSKSMCDRKLSYNNDNFKQIVKHVGIKGCY